MFGKPSLLTRVAVGKTVGFLFGLVGFICLPLIFLEGGWLLRWGILLWYTTVGAVIGIFGVFDEHPLLHFRMPWWFRGLLFGAWMNLVLLFFSYDTMNAIMLSLFPEGGWLSSPFWFVAEGAILGMIIDYLSTRFGGEGKDVVVG